MAGNHGVPEAGQLSRALTRDVREKGVAHTELRKESVAR